MRGKVYKTIDNMHIIYYHKQKLIKMLTERVSISQKAQRAGESVSPV
jgi:hypothetical protein